MQRSPEGALGRKRAGPWEGTELDLDDYRSSKRGRGQEIACDLCHMNLEGGSGAPCQPRDGGNPISDALPAASGATSMHCSEGGGSPQAMQCTPRSEARTPSVQRQGGGGGGGAIGGGQPSVQSSRHRLGGARCTPMRLLDALPPTSPSDPPGLEGVNLRKATLMRSLQSRLMKGEGDSIGPSPPEAATVVMPAGAAGAAAAAAAVGDVQQARAVQWQVQQPPAAHQQQQHVAPHVLNAMCDAQAGPPLAANRAAAAAAAAAAGGGRGSSSSPPEPFQVTSSLSSMMASPGCGRSSLPQPEGQPGQQRGSSDPVHSGFCADMAISPPGRL